jgi:nucleotide-binding universal stress UspA family protein
MFFHREPMASLSSSLPARVVLPADGPWWPWQRGWIADALRARESVMVARRSSIETVLCVDDGSLQLRHWLRQLTATQSIRRVRCLGIVDVSVPWYAGIAFSPAELIQAAERASVELSRSRERSTRAMATWLERRGVPAVAECRQGGTAETILARAHDTGCDLIVLRDDPRDQSELRSIIELSECSVLLVRDAQRNDRCR